MQLALGLPSSTSDNVIVKMITRYHEARNNLHFWLSDNFRPDNVLFRLEHLIHELGERINDFRNVHPFFVPFIPLAKYSYGVMRELLMSALLYFPWFNHVVLGAGDVALREHFGVSPRVIIERLQCILQFLNARFSQSLEHDPLIKIPISTLTHLKSPREKITVLTAVQGKKMFKTSLGMVDYVIFNGNPLEASHVVRVLQEGETNQSQIGCYLMCHFTDGSSSWDDSVIQQSLKTFHGIVRNILIEIGMLKDAGELTNTMKSQLINKVAFQGTRDQFLELMNQFMAQGITYVGVGGPAVWQDNTIMEILSSL